MSKADFFREFGADGSTLIEQKANRTTTQSKEIGATVRQIVKRLFDVVFVICLLPFILLSLVICGVLIKIKSPGPLFYAHQRIGKDGKSFPCLKLRSMVQNADETLEEYLEQNPAARAEYEATRKLQNDPRIIPVVGEFLRKTSLDEVPQFFNVIVGHMSIVGPRPVPAVELELYGERRAQYVKVRPGITGFWQVCGRSDTSYEKRVRMDSYYVRNLSLRTDLFIILKTARVMVTGQGAY